MLDLVKETDLCPATPVSFLKHQQKGPTVALEHSRPSSQ